jgi:nitroreductase
MMNYSKEFEEIVNYRRAVRIFDPNDFNPNSVTQSLKRAILAPSSSNMQLYELYRITDDNKAAKKIINEYCLNQNTSRTAREFVIVVARPDLWRNRAQFNYNTIAQLNPNRQSLNGRSTLNYYKKLMPFLYFNDPFGLTGALRKLIVFTTGLYRPIVREVSKEDIRVVIHKSAALAAQTFMLSMVAEEHDTCPVEGFDSKRLKKYLKLPRRAEINMVITCGKRLPEGIYNERIRLPEDDLIKKLD